MSIEPLVAIIAVTHDRPQSATNSVLTSPKHQRVGRLGTQRRPGQDSESVAKDTDLGQTLTRRRFVLAGRVRDRRLIRCKRSIA